MVGRGSASELLWPASHVVWRPAVLPDGVEGPFLPFSSLRPSEQKTRVAVVGCPGVR